jgi:DNA-nicking Smr family endonuclease
LGNPPKLTMAKKPPPFNNPFGNLSLKKAEPAKAVSTVAPKPPKAAPVPTLDAESRLFLESVGAVEPVKVGKTHAPAPAPRSAAEVPIATEEAESLARLAELVAGDGQFELSDTDEFVEGSVRGLDPRVLRKLKSGDFAWQAHIDLHGLHRDEAHARLDRFVQQGRVLGHRCLLVVHGRGLHSKDNVPVLKQSVQQWLASGRLSRQVLAFCSARPSDGGAGAVYVLLRR